MQTSKSSSTEISLDTNAVSLSTSSSSHGALQSHCSCRKSQIQKLTSQTTSTPASGTDDFELVSKQTLELMWHAAEFHELTTKIETALDEAQARTSAAEAEPKKHDEHTKAVSWWAGDTGRKFEQITDDYAALQKMAKSISDSAAILEAADQDLTTAKVATRTAHELAGLPIPADADPHTTNQTQDHDIEAPVELTEVRTERRKTALDAIPEGGPRYEIDNGAIYKVTYKPDKDGDFEKTKKLIINLEVRIISVEAPAAEVVAGAATTQPQENTRRTKH